MTASPGDNDHDPDVLLAIEGDSEALERLLRNASDEIKRSIQIEPSWNRSIAVDDILQVTYLEAFLRIPSLKDASRAAFIGWLRRIANNNLIDAIRGLKRHKRSSSNKRVTQGASGESARTLLMAVAGDGVTAGTAAVLADEIARMKQAIQKLPASYREVVTALELDERPVGEIAEQLGKSPGAIFMLRSRALDRLRELLKEDAGSD